MNLRSSQQYLLAKKHIITDNAILISKCGKNEWPLLKKR
jgi:hypothetical protein